MHNYVVCFVDNKFSVLQIAVGIAGQTHQSHGRFITKIWRLLNYCFSVCNEICMYIYLTNSIRLYVSYPEGKATKTKYFPVI